MKFTFPFFRLGVSDGASPSLSGSIGLFDPKHPLMSFLLFLPCHKSTPPSNRHRPWANLGPSSHLHDSPGVGQRGGGWIFLSNIVKFLGWKSKSLFCRNGEVVRWLPLFQLSSQSLSRWWSTPRAALSRTTPSSSSSSWWWSTTGAASSRSLPLLTSSTTPVSCL